jgi:glyoxylase-like metal-dependent hydrolase (beta-lactamase superfamily II)
MTAQRKKIGQIEVTAVSDGVLAAPLDVILGMDKAEVERLAGKKDAITISVNAFLLKLNGKWALVDAGSGNTMGPTLGKLPDNLRAIGVPPEAIDFVLLTHIHPDHSNGLVDDDGRANYPNAEVIVHGEDLRFWVEREPQASDNEFRQRNMKAARRAFGPYRDRTRAIRGGEPLPGISAHPQPGHTPGHTGWLVSSGADALLIWGDIVHVTGVQFARPDAALTFDLDPNAARASRARVFDWVSADRIRVAGAHLDLPAFGHVARSGSGYRFEAEA